RPRARERERVQRESPWLCQRATRCDPRVSQPPRRVLPPEGAGCRSSAPEGSRAWSARSASGLLGGGAARRACYQREAVYQGQPAGSVGARRPVLARGGSLMKPSPKYDFPVSVWRESENRASSAAAAYDGIYLVYLNHTVHLDIVPAVDRSPQWPPS